MNLPPPLSAPSSSDDVIASATILTALQLTTPLPATTASANDSSASAALLQQQQAQVTSLHQALDVFLPTRTWSKLPLPLDTVLISELKIQHSALPTLQVKVIHGVDGAQANELDQALLWLHESIGQPYPVVGIHVESDHASIRVLTFSTSSRALLIRIPDRMTLMQLATNAAEIANSSINGGSALSSSSAASADSLPPDSLLFSPLFYQFLSNRGIFKSGLDACTHAMQLYELFDFQSVHPIHPHFELNSGLNISWNRDLMMASQQQRLHLNGGANINGGGVRHDMETIVDSVLGMKNSYRCDVSQQYTEWGAERLTLRQLIYASLNAQVSYVIACTQNLPTPFHLTDLPRAWILHAASWRSLQLRQAEIAAAFALGLRSNEDEPQDDPVVTNQLAHQSELYYARFTQSEEPLNPFITALLEMSNSNADPSSTPSIFSHSFPSHSLTTSTHLAQSLSSINPMSLEGSGLAVEASNPYWWCDEIMKNDRASSQLTQEYVRKLDSQQYSALQAMDSHRIVSVNGCVGSGKTTLLIAVILAALDRSSSISLTRASQSVRMSNQRVLVVGEPSSLMIITTLLSRILPADRVCWVATHTAHSHQQQVMQSPLDTLNDLQAEGYVHFLDHAAVNTPASLFAFDRDVLLVTPDSALFNPAISRLVRCRQTLLMEDANTMWMMRAVLLLRKLPHTERVMIVGDQQAIKPIVAKSETQSVLDVAGSVAMHQQQLIHHHQQHQSSLIPPSFLISHHHLSTPYRSSPHLSALLSSLFYRGTLQTSAALLNSENSLAVRRKRAIGWVHVPSSSSICSERGSWSNLTSDIPALEKLWSHYISSGLEPSEMMIIPLHAAACRDLRSSSLSHAFSSRVFSITQCLGHTASIVFILLSSPGVTHHLADTRQALIAMSRSKYKTYILGDADVIGRYHSVWRLVEEWTEKEWTPPVMVVQQQQLKEQPIVEEENAIPDEEAVYAPMTASSTSTAAPLTHPSISSDDAPRLANLYSLFLLHSPPPHTGPLLIDNIGKYFKTRFGSSWRIYEKMDRDAKLIVFLMKHPTMWRVLNVEESVHVQVEWIGSAEVVAYLRQQAPKSFGGTTLAVGGTFAAVTPAVNATAASDSTAVSASASAAASGSSTSAPMSASAAATLGPLVADSVSSFTPALDPFTFYSVSTLDSTIPQLDAELIDGLIQTICSATQPILLSDLSRSFKHLHKINWTHFTELKLGEFLRKYSPTYFKFRANSKEAARNPIVECVITDLVPDESILQQQNELPKTVIASNVVSSGGPTAPKRQTSGGGGANVSSAAALVAATVSAPITVVASTTPSVVAQPPIKSTKPSPPTTTPANSTPGDVLAVATLLSSSISAHQIDDSFRLECLRLVFLYNANTGILLTEIGNAFHALFGLRWKRLTKTELRVSDFLYDYSGIYVEFDYTTKQYDLDGSHNPLVFYAKEKIYQQLFIVTQGTAAAGTAAKVTIVSIPVKKNDRAAGGSTSSAASAANTAATGKRGRDGDKAADSASATNGKKNIVTRSSSSTTPSNTTTSSSSKTTPPVTASPDDFQPVRRTGSSGAKIQSTPATTSTATSSATAVAAIPTATCSWCQTVIPPGERVCPNCESVIGASSNSGGSNKKEEEWKTSGSSAATATPPIASAPKRTQSTPNNTSKQQQQQQQKNHSPASTEATTPILTPQLSRSSSGPKTQPKAAEKQSTAVATPTVALAPTKAGKKEKAQQAPPVITAAATTSEDESSPVAPVSPVATASTLTTASASDRDPYDDSSFGLSRSSYYLTPDLDSLSKKERRKLMWLCSGCKTENEQKAMKCELCDERKPGVKWIRFKKEGGGVSGSGEEKKNGGNALSTLTKQPSSSSSTSSSNPNSSSSSLTTTSSTTSTYENDYIRLSFTPELGYHYISKVQIPSGTFLIQDDIIWSTPAGALESAMGSCIPNEVQFSELIMKLIKDPMMSQILHHRNVTQYAMIGKLLNLKKPKDIGMKEWSAGVEMALTGAQFYREPAPGHHKSCTCSYGRFWLKRQSALLLHSCWPNCAHVKRPYGSGSGNGGKGESYININPLFPTHTEVHSIMSTQDIPAGTILTDCMNSGILNLPRDRRIQWITQTTGKPTCTCDRCTCPANSPLRRMDQQLTAVVNLNVKLDQKKVEEDYEAILKQHSKLHTMPRTIPDDPSFSSPLHDERFYHSCYDFLSTVNTFLTCYHMLSTMDWRKQYLRNLFVNCCAKYELWDMDLMHPDERRFTNPTQAAAAAAQAAAGSGSSSATVSQSTLVVAKSPLKGRWITPLNPNAKGYEDKRTRNHWYLQTILHVLLSHIDANAQFYSPHEPLKCSAILLMYDLIDWFRVEELEHCVQTRLLSDGVTEIQSSCFNFTFERKKNKIGVYLHERLMILDPHAEDFYKAGFPLRA